MESVSQADTQTEGEREREERIMARRRRVEAKLEAKRKAEAGEEPEEVCWRVRTLSMCWASSSLVS